jgi:hypothetical protein
MRRLRLGRSRSPSPRKALADYRKAFPQLEIEAPPKELGRQSPGWRKGRRRPTGAGALSHGMRAKLRMRRNLERIRMTRRRRLNRSRR